MTPARIHARSPPSWMTVWLPFLQLFPPLFLRLACLPIVVLLSFCPWLFKLYFHLTAPRSLTNITSHGSGICFCPLTSYRKLFSVPSSAIRLDVFKACDISAYNLAKLPFYFESFLNVLFYAVQVFRRKVFSALCGVYLCFAYDILCARASDAVYVAQRYAYSFFVWNCDTE